MSLHEPISMFHDQSYPVSVSSLGTYEVVRYPTEMGTRPYRVIPTKTVHVKPRPWDKKCENVSLRGNKGEAGHRTPAF